jgi:hypothetical protein
MCTPHWCSGIVVVFVFLQFMDERQGETWRRSLFHQLFSYLFDCIYRFRSFIRKSNIRSTLGSPVSYEGTTDWNVLRIFSVCGPDHLNDGWWALKVSSSSHLHTHLHVRTAENEAGSCSRTKLWYVYSLISLAGWRGSVLPTGIFSACASLATGNRKAYAISENCY